MLLINHPSSFFERLLSLSRDLVTSPLPFKPIHHLIDVVIISSSKFVFVIIILSPFKMIGELPDYVIQYLLSYLVRNGNLVIL